MTSDGLSAAEAAIRELFYDPDADTDYEPLDEASAREAITQLGVLITNMPGLVKRALAGAQDGAEMLSGDRFQGLAEIIQNADDVEARNVWFQVTDDTLTAVHDGRPIQLRDLQALATPWVSTKIRDAASTGRFGIGLMTLRALSDSIDIHCDPYHLRLAGSAVISIDAVDLPVHADRVDRADVTALTIPLPRDVDIAAIARWLSRWDDNALLFCRHVERIHLLGADGSTVRTLGLEWTPLEGKPCIVGGQELLVTRRRARASDGRSWLVHSVDAARPTETSRAHKATAPTTPLAVALPLDTEQTGALYAGLPLIDLRIPVRVNAQFDPLTSRQGLADTAWNAQIVPLLADLWVQAAEELFLEYPQAAWAAVPLPGDESAPSITHRVEAMLLDQARLQLSQRIRIRVDGTDVPLAEIAIEDPPLEGLLSPDEIAALAGTATSMPVHARDPGGRWRRVLDDWRAHGADLPAPVSVERALILLDDKSRSTEQTIALTAAGLNAGLDSQLASRKCITTVEGERIVPPSKADHRGLLTSALSLAEQLGIGLLLHPAHLTSQEDAHIVLRWLQKRGSVIDSADTHAAIRRLAAAGRSGNPLDRPLTDEQIRALRDAFEQMDPRGRDELGHDVGSAIQLAAYYYDSQGQRVATHAHPASAYLPRAIDRDAQSFASAASTAPGLRWLHGRYAEVLRSSQSSNAGLGPQRFLRLLGAEIAPRLAPHKGLYRRYESDSRRGLDVSESSPQHRSRELSKLGATHTLEDVDSPDLRSVALHIAREKIDLHRRQRAAALLATLGRAWDRLSDRAAVRAAHDHYGWQMKGSVKAFWLWSVGSIPWLDDAEGTPRPPCETRLRTPGTIAVYGATASGYLHPDFNNPARRDVLAELGVLGEPNTRDLVARLRSLRDGPTTEADERVGAAIIYEALGDRLAANRPLAGDLSLANLRRQFAEPPGLILTEQGWQVPSKVLAGDPVFGRHRAFHPQVPGARQLWVTLQVRDPSLEDCLAVIGECARTRRRPEGEDVAVVLETLRLLAGFLAREAPSPHTAKRLRRLSLWTSRGWTTQRPVYAVDDPALAEGLGGEYRVWLPGGRLSQFKALFEPLRIHAVSSDDVTVIDPDAATVDEDATRLWRSAVSSLQSDLAFNEPSAAAALRMTWDRLSAFEVRTNADLRACVSGLGGDREVEIPVRAKADATAQVLYLAGSQDLRRVDVGGQAVASLFDADRRQIAQAWLAACAAAADERAVQPIELAIQRAKQERAHTHEEMEARLGAIRQEAAEHIMAASAGNAKRLPVPPHATAPAAREVRPRELVDPSRLVVVDPQGRLGSSTNGAPVRSSRTSSGLSSAELPAPVPGGAVPRTYTAAPQFTPAQVEDLGLELVRMVFASDGNPITDLRGQRGVGADAVDSRGRFYELKVYLNEEPDVIRLQHSEIRRAMSTPDFSLVVVSGLEGPAAQPRVRVIIDPLSQLSVLESSAVYFAGVHSIEHSLIYDLAY